MRAVQETPAVVVDPPLKGEWAICNGDHLRM